MWLLNGIVCIHNLNIGVLFVTVIDQLNRYSNLLLVIVTLILVIVTAIYVIITNWILREARKERENQKLPVIAFRFRIIRNAKTGKIEKIQERLVNIGSGPALDIELEVNIEFVKKGNKVSIKGFSKAVAPIPKEIETVDNVLGVDTGDPDMQICFFISKTTSILKDPRLRMKVTYKDIFGKTHITLFENCKNIFQCGNV